MLNATLSHIGLALSENFEINKSKVIFDTRDALFKRLSERNLPLEFPAISFSMSDISPVDFRRKELVLFTNLNETLAKKYSFILLNVTVSLAILAANAKDYTDFCLKYFLLNFHSLIETRVVIDNTEQIFNLQIKDLQPLTVPPTGREGFDYDRGNLYVMEGGFTVQTFLLYDKEVKIIRKVDFNLSYPGS